MRTDVKNEEDIKAAAEETVRRYGRLDIAVNNAEVELFSGTVDQASRDEIANTIAWLASDQSSFTTGSSIPVEGGFLAR